MNIELDPMDLESLLETFQEESRQRLSCMEEIVLALEPQAVDDESHMTLLRIAHTIKGSAACLEFMPLADFAQAVENLLESVHDRMLPVTDHLITLLLQAINVLGHLVPAAVAGEENLEPAHVELLRQLDELAMTPLSKG